MGGHGWWLVDNVVGRWMRIGGQATQQQNSKSLEFTTLYITWELIQIGIFVDELKFCYLVEVSQLNVDKNDGLTLMWNKYCGIGK